MSAARRRIRQVPGALNPESTATVEHVTQLLGQPQQAVTPSRRRKSRFTLTEVSPGLRSLALVFGVFLAYAVLRIQELYPVLNVARLPFFMAIGLALAVVASTPMQGWRAIWDSVPSVRWQLLLVILAVITAPVGIWMSGSLHYFVDVYSVSLIVFLVTVVILRDRRALASTLRLLLLAAGFIASYTLSDTATTMGRSGRVRLGVTLDPNDLAMLLVALTPMALWMAQRKGGRSLGWTVVAFLTVAAIVPTESRGAILGLGAVALVLISLGTSGWRRTLYIVGTILVALGLFAFATSVGADRLGDFSDYSGGESRIAIWKRGLVWMTWRPWGYGLDNFPLFFGWMNGNERATHNSFIQIGVELGVLALLAFAMLFLHTGRDLLRQRRHALSLRGTIPDAEREASLVTFTLAMMAGTAVAGFFLSKAYAGITLFAQGIGIAVLLGYPYRGMMHAPEVMPAGNVAPAGRRGASPARPGRATLRNGPRLDGVPRRGMWPPGGR